MKKHEIKCTEDNVIFKWPEKQEELTEGSIYLTKHLSKDVGWAECVSSGPDCLVQPGDSLLLSRRVTTMNLPINGETLNNTSDKSVMAFKSKGDNTLKCTHKTFLYERITEPEERTESGIYLIKKEVTKEFSPIWVKVVAAGPETGVQAGDEVMIAYKGDMYTIKVEVDGELKTLHNAGSEEIICFRRN